MATNSKREQLIISDLTLVQGISLFKTIQRVRPTYSDLIEFAQPQMPVAAIVGAMPIPISHKGSREVGKDQYIMSLDVQIFAYLMVNEDADTALSNMADELWRELQSDQSRGNLAIETTVKPSEVIHVFAPFAGALITVNHKYTTGIGGI